MERRYRNQNSDLWFKSITEDLLEFPFAFSYGDKSYSGFGEFEILSKEINKNGNKEILDAFFEVDENLRLNLKCTHNYDFGETEWTVWFENIGKENTKVLYDLKATLNFEGENPLLKGILGDHVNYYRPYCLEPKQVHFETNEPFPTHIYFPYFNLEYGSSGTMLAIGWSGTWSADFFSDGNTTSYVARSTPFMHTYLKPGEKIRTALFVRADYTVRDENFATNYWRKWFLKENMPKADKDGNDIKPFSTAFLYADTGLPNSDGSISENYKSWKPSMEKMLSVGIKTDFRWVDAGWYQAPDGSSAIPFKTGHDWAFTLGTWELDKTKWPDKTFLESTDYAREKGMKTLLWFSPEMVQDVPSLVKNHGYKAEWAADFGCYNENYWINWISNLIGNEECFDWTVGRIKKVLTDNKIEMYREDVNLEPARNWRLQDLTEGFDRLGITELKQTDAHYRLLDEMIKTTSENGGCAFVDCCAGGGGRNDLESLRRGVPILRSDRDRTSTGVRLSISSTLNKWIPINGSAMRAKVWETDVNGYTDKYIFRASLLPILNIDGQFVYQEDEAQFEIIRQGMAEWKKVCPYFFKDFYPHTDWHIAEDLSGFTAFSYFDAEKKEGVLLTFRQEKCEEDTLCISLPFVGENETCALTDEDTGETEAFSGDISLYFDAPRTARILWIKVK